MKISIITATYNSAATVRDTLQSVLQQTYQDIEYVIVDGDSKDATLDIVREYESRFQGRMSWKSEPDKGIYDAMNKGITRATGEVVGILNSDDLFIDSESIKKVMDLFDTNLSLDCVYADLYYVSQTDINNVIRKWSSGKQRKFSSGWHPAHPTFYVKKTVYERLGVFDLKFKLAADFELMLRFIEKGEIKMTYLPKALVKMRLGGATSKSITNSINQNKECYQSFKQNNIPVSIFYPLLRILPKLIQYIAFWR